MGVAEEVGRSLGAWIKAVAINALISTLLFMVGFALVGMPWWFLTGGLCGLLNLIPQIGSILALGFALLVRLFSDGDWNSLLTVGAVWLAIQIIEGFVLAPRAASRSGVNPFLSIILVLAGGMLFGPIGLILAVPVAAVVLIILRAIRSPGTRNR